MERDTHTTNNDLLPDQTLSIPIIEEQAIITKEAKETGKVRIEKKVSERKETVEVSLSHEEHSIEHVPMNIYVDAIPITRQEGNTLIIPVLEEVIVKRTLLVEEIRITKNTIQTNEPLDVTLRKENVTVERVL